MKILLLAPHPFFQERGTPIAVKLLLQVLSDRGHSVDVLTYHEGETIAFPNVRIFRIAKPPFVSNIHPGFSLKKLVCDLFMAVKIFGLVGKNRYQVIHAVEESVFLALLVRWVTGIPYVYDMDSSLPDQMMEQMPVLVRLKKTLKIFERAAIRKSIMVMPVCRSLADIAEGHGARNAVILPDISLLESEIPRMPILLRERLGIAGPLLMYIGNLESYQGIDLLIESFAMAYRSHPTARLVIIGGSADHISRYREKCGRLHLEGCVHFLGPKPLADLGIYLSEADILVSPRIKGTNTPMKIYSYLHSGKPVLATDLSTHTQVLDSRIAVLAPPNPGAFSKGMLHLIENPGLATGIGERGRDHVVERYSYAAFKKTLCGAYDSIESQLDERAGSA